MNITNNSTEQRLLVKVSSMYYDQELNQQEIADRLNLSRPKVSRLLKQARETGVVQIKVITPSTHYINLEIELERRFNLQEVIIVDGDNITKELLKRQLGIAAADYLLRTITKNDVVGVTWGTTLQEMIDALIPLPTENVHVVQALGGVGPPEAKAHSTDISRRLSQILNSKLTLLSAPGIVGSTEAKNILLSDWQVKSALELFSKINKLFVGLGGIETNPVLQPSSNDVTENLYNEIISSEAVGDIALRFFDIKGNPVASKLDELTIGITIPEIQNIDTVIAIAGGLEKLNVILGALSGQLINVLITDRETSEAILQS